MLSNEKGFRFFLTEIAFSASASKLILLFNGKQFSDSVFRESNEREDLSLDLFGSKLTCFNGLMGGGHRYLSMLPIWRTKL